jgi:hypothetical protein
LLFQVALFLRLLIKFPLFLKLLLLLRVNFNLDWWGSYHINLHVLLRRDIGRLQHFLLRWRNDFRGRFFGLLIMVDSQPYGTTIGPGFGFLRRNHDAPSSAQ